MDKIDKLVERYVDNEHSVKSAVARREASSGKVGGVRSKVKKKKKHQDSQEASPKG